MRRWVQKWLRRKKTQPNRPRHRPYMTPAHGCQADQALLRHNRSTGPDGYRFFRYASGLFHCAARVLALFIAAEGNIDHSLPLLITAEGNIDPPCPHRKAFLARCLLRRNASVTLHPCKFHGHTGFCQKVHAPGTRLPPAKLNRPSTPSAQTDAMKQRRC